MIIPFVPKTTYFAEPQKAPVAVQNTIPASAINEYEYIDIIDDDEREYRRMMQHDRLQTIIIVMLVALLLFAILNIRISFVQTDPITGSARGDIILFVRALSAPEPGDVMLTEYDFSNPKFDTVDFVSDTGYVNFGSIRTENDVTINKTMHTAETFHTLCIIPIN